MKTRTVIPVTQLRNGDQCVTGNNVSPVTRIGIRDRLYTINLADGTQFGPMTDGYSIEIEVEQANTHLCVSFEPEAIRAHFEADEPDPTKDLTDEQLEKIGQYAIAADSLWAEFHRLLVEAVEAYEEGLIV